MQGSDQQSGSEPTAHPSLTDEIHRSKSIWNSSFLPPEIQIDPTKWIIDLAENESKFASWCLSYSPSTSDFPGLIPDLLEERVVLDNDGVLDVRSLGCGGSVAVRVASCRHSTLKQKMILKLSPAVSRRGKSDVGLISLNIPVKRGGKGRWCFTVMR